MADKVRFQTNINEEIQLARLDPKEVQSQFGSGTEFMFSLSDGRVMFLPPPAAQKLLELAPSVGESIDICRREVIKGNRKQLEWQISRVGEPPAALVQPHKNGNGSHKPTPAAPPPIPPMPETPAPDPAAAAKEFVDRLVRHTNALIDAYAAAVQYASETYGNTVRPEDVRALLTTCFINISQKGGR